MPARTVALGLAMVLLAALVVLSGGPAVREAKAAPPGPPLPVRAPTGQFELVGGKIYDPNGVQFIPVGTNLNGPNSFFSVPTAGKAQQLQDDWGFNTVRLVTCVGTCDEQFVAFPADLNAIVAEYTAREMVVMIEYHELPPGTNPTPAQINAAAAFWISMANAYKTNPYVWFNLYNEPQFNRFGPTPVARLWRNQHQPVIDAIRAAGAPNLLVLDDAEVGQGAYIYGQPWNMNPVPGADSGVLTEGVNIVDPQRRTAFSFHAYDVWGYPNDGNQQCRNRFTDAQRDARMANYVQRVQAQGLVLLVGEVGYFSWEQPTTGRSYHGSFAPTFWPPCGSTQLLAADALYRIAATYDLGILSWHGFDLTSAGAQNWTLNNPAAPTNLTRWGQQHWGYTTQQGKRVPGAPTCGVPPVNLGTFQGVPNQLLSGIIGPPYPVLGPGAEIRFFFGDGTSSAWLSDGDVLAHTYSAAGTYSVSAHVRYLGSACFQDLGVIASVQISAQLARGDVRVRDEVGGEGGHPIGRLPSPTCDVAAVPVVAADAAVNQRIRDRASRTANGKRDELLVDFGDGTNTGWIKPWDHIDKTYAEPGVYEIQAVVRNGAGDCQQAMGTIAVVTVTPDDGRRPRAAKPLEIDLV